MEILCESLKLLIGVLALVYVYYRYSFTYWKKRNVKTIKPSIPFGSVENPLKRTKPQFKTLENYYKQLKNKGAIHGGMYVGTHPVYIPVHPETVKNVLTKDFGHFVDRGIYHNEKDDPISAHLFSIGGDKWRLLRTKLTPTFTSGKMKTMFPTLVACADQMNEFVHGVVERGNPLDIKEIFACFTTDVIGSCSFGLECNCFNDPDSEFRRYSNRMFSLSKMEAFKMMVTYAAPRLAKALHFERFQPDLSKFFMSTVASTIAYREENNYVRNDFMQLLIELKNSNGLTLNEVTAQAFVFFGAGFETSSSTMTYCLLELAQDDEIQERVREEILEVVGRYNGEITYDNITEMKYLGQVVDETLRKYPVTPIIMRRCTKTYKIPNTDAVIGKGTSVNIPVFGLQRDEEYFPDPDKFDPERFSEENKDKIVPYTYLPFGEGPRNCIGMRFGLMQTKVGIVALLMKYRVQLNKNTELPLQYDPYGIFIGTLNTIWLDMKKL